MSKGLRRSSMGTAGCFFLSAWILGGCGSSSSTTGTTSGGGGESSSTTTTTATGTGGSGGGQGGAGGGTTTTTTGSGGGQGGNGGQGGSLFCQPGTVEACYDGPMGTQDVGPCHGGQHTCDADGKAYGPCVGEVTPVAETCSTPIDDDCNGMINDMGPDCACAPGSMKSCYDGPMGTENVGICKAGTQTCAMDGTGYGPCVGAVFPAFENCIKPGDEDCDGIAQMCTGAHVWSKSFGDAGAQTSVAVALTYLRGAVITGSFASTVNFGGGMLASTGSTDVYVAAFDSGGAHAWSKRFGDNLAQTGRGVATDPAGNTLLIGDFTGAINFGGGPLNTAGSTDVYVAKLDVLGNHLWSKRFGNASAQSGTAIGSDADGNVIIAGNFAGVIDLGTGPLTSKGSTDIFVAKLDPTGATLWAQRFGDASAQTVNALAIDKDGNIAITGALAGGADFGGGVIASAGSNDVYVAKLNGLGNHLWSKRFGDVSAQSGTGLSFDGDGNLIVVGDEVGTVNFGGGPLTSAGSTDIFIVKFDPMGAHMWSQRFGNASAQNSHGVSVDEVGNAVLVGDLGGAVNFGGGLLTSAGSTDVMIAKFDGLGNPIWSQRYGDIAAQNGNAVIATSTTVFMTGTFAGTVNFGGGPLVSGGTTDIFLARLDP
ncbi:MAG: nucleotide-binding protein [Byssovorax sp.]